MLGGLEFRGQRFKLGSLCAETSMRIFCGAHYATYANFEADHEPESLPSLRHFWALLDKAPRRVPRGKLEAVER